MSFKRESMPSINESDNEEEDNLSISEEFSTSDYSSLNRLKNSTLTKAVCELFEHQEEILNKVATLKSINYVNNETHPHIATDSNSNNSGLSHESLESDKEDSTSHICSDSLLYYPNNSNDLEDKATIIDTENSIISDIIALKELKEFSDQIESEIDCNERRNSNFSINNETVEDGEINETYDRKFVLPVEAINDVKESEIIVTIEENKTEIDGMKAIEKSIYDKVSKYQANETDRFGFLKGNQYTDPNSDVDLPISVIRTRERKWQDMLNKWEDYKTRKRKKMVSRCRKGIPQSMRCKAWQFLCNSRSLETTFQERTFYKEQLKVPKRKETLRISFRNSTQAVNNSDNDSISVSSFYSTVSPAMRPECVSFPTKSYHHEMYENYKKCTPNCEIVEQIRKDIHRQFPNHENFMQKGGLGQESLSTILTVYSIRHPETGYCQGMAPLAAALLMVMPEEDAFWTFDKICDSYIPGYYDDGLKQIQIDAKALNALLKKESSNVYNYLNVNQIDPICYMIDWFMCIYIRTLPWPSVLQVIDMFLCEGKSILFKVALVLVIGAIGLHKQSSKDCQDNDILTSLRNLPDSITSTKYITTHIAKLTVSKTDIKRECQNQETIMAKARARGKSMSKVQ